MTKACPPDRRARRLEHRSAQAMDRDRAARRARLDGGGAAPGGRHGGAAAGVAARRRAGGARSRPAARRAARVGEGARGAGFPRLPRGADAGPGLLRGQRDSRHGLRGAALLPRTRGEGDDAGGACGRTRDGIAGGAVADLRPRDGDAAGGRAGVLDARRQPVGQGGDCGPAKGQSAIGAPAASPGASQSRHAAIAALPDWFAPSVQNTGAPAGRVAVARSQSRDRPIADPSPSAAACAARVMPFTPRAG